MLPCLDAECTQTFESEHGRKVHIGRKHKALAKLLREQANALDPPPDPTDRPPSSPSVNENQLPPDHNDTNENQDSDNENVQVIHSQPEEANQDEVSSITEDPLSTSAEEPIICSVCQQEFDSNRALSVHFTRHTIEANEARVYNLRPRPSQPVADSADPASSSPPSLRAKCDNWFNLFDRITRNLSTFDRNFFFEKMTEFQAFVREATEFTAGPVHPATIYFRRRRKRRNKANWAKQSNRSNPKRTDKKRRKRMLAKYYRDLAQFQYFYQRRKIARRVLDGETNNTCSIPIESLFEHFSNVFDQVNNSTIEQYPQPESPFEDIQVTVDEVRKAINKIKIDTSPGYDRVLMRTVKDLNIASVIQRIVTIMLATGTVPPSLGEGRTIPIPKKGNADDVSNLRPITIYSVIRRIIERILDKRLREQVQLNHNQRGFQIGLPGCHMNSSLINACLTKSKEDKSDLVVVFLDLTKAFDRIGHSHLELCLKSRGVSKNMARLIMALLSNNKIRVDTGRERTEQIQIRRSVPQGGPLSPMLFNTAIDYVYDEICDSDFAREYGFKLADGHDPLILTGFADDQVITANSVESALRVVNLIQDLFSAIGLEINPSKSTALVLSKGVIVPGSIDLSDGTTIECVDKDTTIKYLGCSFENELVFDKSTIPSLTDKINNVVRTTLLKANQKLNVLNQYLLPRLTYPLQAAPLRKIPKSHLQILDVTLRNSAKAIIGLPTATATPTFYAPRKLRGLGLVCAEWEAPLQHLAIASKLASVPDALFHAVYDCEEEIEICKTMLGIEGETSRQIRANLREREFNKWKTMNYQGIGVKHFSDFPRGNRFAYDQGKLSSSEWTASLKLNNGYANLRGVPGVVSSSDPAALYCRHKCRTKETPSHVLGCCPHGEHLRNSRHHSLKNKIAELLREKGFHCVIEAYCKDGGGENRYVDILAAKPGLSTAFIIDPTVRWESNGDVGEVVQRDKASIYDSCVPYIKENYTFIGKRDVEVIGLWFGARGTICKRTVDFFDRIGLPRASLPDLGEAVLAASIRMVHHHIYSTM